MLLKLALVFMALLFAAAYSGPVGANEVSRPVRFIGTRSNANNGTNQDPSKSINDCGDSTFNSDSGFGSPLVSDCLQIVTNIADGGAWHMETVTCKHHQLVQFGTCAFGAHSCSSHLSVNIGNQDIMDLIHESIRLFNWNDTVAAHGGMQCQTPLRSAFVNWDLYHN